MTPSKSSLIAALALSITFITGCSENEPVTQQAPAAMPVRVATPTLETLPQWHEFTGRFAAKERVEIRSRVNGFLEKINFIAGQNVNQGDVLFVIDQRSFKTKLKSAQADFELAKSVFSRAQTLRKTNAISEELYFQRQQELLVAEAALENAKLDLEFTEVKAPFSGKIGRNLVSVGSLIDGGNTNATLLTTLVSTSPIEFYYEGSEADLLAFYRAREKGEASISAPNTHPVYIKLQDEQAFVHEGRFNFVNNELNIDTGTIEARAIFDNKDGLFTPGMFARLRIQWTKPQQLIVVPELIIGTEQTRKYVYAVGEGNVAVRKYVKLGQHTEDGKRAIIEGLSSDDQIIVGNLHLIRPGAPVSPITAAEEQNGESK